jgi:hypothetical protein
MAQSRTFNPTATITMRIHHTRIGLDMVFVVAVVDALRSVVEDVGVLALVFAGLFLAEVDHVVEEPVGADQLVGEDIHSL